MFDVAVMHLQMQDMRTPNAHAEVSSKRDDFSSGQRDCAEYTMRHAARKKPGAWRRPGDDQVLSRALETSRLDQAATPVSIKPPHTGLLHSNT
ncbi:hypothetical protein ACFQS6_12920 [Xanthomonas populi]|uniref:Uncharacterized protein n=1 Tax=Xanthomonas populi TaxID=53414 RepID=A0A2S7EZQ9_9XANT|nr:hypothetical protein [Xanthomonas populi]PPU98576.1 hypothetical protein XpopCFBP1817_03800 [Xanthomonas populi]